MARSKKRKSKKKTNYVAHSGNATAASASDCDSRKNNEGRAEMLPTPPAGADTSHEAAKGKDFVHELTRSIYPIADALSAIDDSDIDYKLDGDCPYCLEALPPHWEDEKRMMLSCCGAQCCIKCQHEAFDHAQRSFQRKGYLDEADKQLGDHCALCRQAYSVDEREDEARLLAHAAKGRAWAQHSLGYCHLTGKGVLRPNARLGIELMIRSAKKGYPRTLFDFGRMYTSGKPDWGIEHSMTNAKFCFEEAANRGHMGARFKLSGILNLEGKYEEGTEHLKIAVDAGYPKAIFTLGWFLHHGSEGNEKKISSARLYLEEAANLGYQEAVDFLKEHSD